MKYKNLGELIKSKGFLKKFIHKKLVQKKIHANESTFSKWCVGSHKPQDIRVSVFLAEILNEDINYINLVMQNSFDINKRKPKKKVPIQPHNTPKILLESLTKKTGFSISVVHYLLQRHSIEIQESELKNWFIGKKLGGCDEKAAKALSKILQVDIKEIRISLNLENSN